MHLASQNLNYIGVLLYPIKQIFQEPLQGSRRNLIAD